GARTKHRRLGLGARAVPEEPPFEGLQELLVDERVDVLVHAFTRGDLEVVRESVVRSLESVAHLVPLEHEVVGPRTWDGAVPRVDGTTDGPDGAGAALDPDDDLVTGPVLTDGVHHALGDACAR